ncbi:hypothetical protein CCS92_34890, partial [Methylobacterium radiotolerans]
GAPGIGKATLAYRVARRLPASPAGGGTLVVAVPPGDVAPGTGAGRPPPHQPVLPAIQTTMYRRL